MNTNVMFFGFVLVALSVFMYPKMVNGTHLRWYKFRAILSSLATLIGLMVILLSFIPLTN